MSEQQQELEALAAIYGPMACHSEYQRGDVIRFRNERGQTQEGEIIWIKPPGPNYAGGPDRPTTYIVGSPAGPTDAFPEMVYESDIIA